MKDQRSGLRVAGLLFALFSIAHLLRLFLRLDVQVGGHAIAMWPSWVAAFVAGAITVWLWSLSSGTGRT